MTVQQSNFIAFAQWSLQLLSAGRATKWKTASAPTSHCPTWRWFSLLTTLTVNLWKIKWLHFKPECRPLKAGAHLSCQSALGSGPEVFEEAFIMTVQLLSHPYYSIAAGRLVSNPICCCLQHTGPQTDAQVEVHLNSEIVFSLSLTTGDVTHCDCV